MKLTSDQLYTLKAAQEHREISLKIYSMDARTQRYIWESEVKPEKAFRNQELSDRAERDPNSPHSLLDLDELDIFRTQDEWLMGVAKTIDAFQPNAAIYLLADEVDAENVVTRDVDVHRLWNEARIEDKSRIVFWGVFVGFYGPLGGCRLMRAGSPDYFHAITPMFCLGMLAASLAPAQTRPIGTTDRHGLAKAHMKPRRDFYYVPNVSYEARPVEEAKGGHHGSPVAHDRRAHQALLTRVEVEAEEAQDLTGRGYQLVWTEELPPEVLAGMKRRGKAPTPGTLNAYRWIDRPQMRVNAEGEQAQRVTIIHPTRG